MILRKPTIDDVLTVRHWRNTCPEALRTAGKTTAEQQKKFYMKLQEVDNMKYFSAYDGDVLIGFTGLTGIDKENKNAEISLIIDPEQSGKGYGKQIVKMILDKAFNEYGLNNVYGEVYHCNDNFVFWVKICAIYNGYTTRLPQRKIWQGKEYDSMYFNINKEEYNGENNTRY